MLINIIRHVGLVLPVLALALLAPGQKPVLVKDLVQDPKAGYDASPDQLTLAGNTLFFTAHTAPTGRELFASVGGIRKPFLVKDLSPGPTSSRAKALCAMGGKLYFALNRQLWVSDGTASGTVLITSTGSDITGIDRVGQRLVIRAGWEVWFSDGSKIGTVKLQQPVMFYQVQPVGNLLYFGGMRTDVINRFELWRSDGTVKGTGKIADSRVQPIVGAFGNKVVFCKTGPQGKSLWISDGTAQGTVSLGNLDAVRGTEWSGKFYFTVTPAGYGSIQIYVTDGTPKGTRYIHTMNGVQSAHPIAAGKNLFLVDSSGNSKTALWRSDGTAKGTFELLNSILWQVMPRAFGNQLLFTAYHEGKGWEPWISDGSRLHTRILADISAGPGSSLPSGYTMLPGGYVAFSAYDGKVGTELWVSDGSARNTWLVGDLDPTPPRTRSSGVRLERSHAGLTMLKTSNAGLATWVTDGTTQGTRRLSDRGSRSRASSAALGSSILYGAMTTDKPSGSVLMRTDGTPAGTLSVRSFSANMEPTYFVRMGRYVYFSAGDSGSGYGLWRSDGTSSGTSLVKKLRVQKLITWRGRLYFFANDSVTNRLFRSDGTASGTVAIKSSIGMPEMSLIVPANEHLYFTTQFDLYRTDGTASGVARIKDANQKIVLAAQLVKMGKVAYFLGYSMSMGTGLWRTDGTPKGTYLVKAAHYLFSRNGTDLVVVGKTLYFVATAQSTGYEIWKSDGTTKGTTMVKDIYPGSRGGVFTTLDGKTLGAVGKWLYFAGDDGVNGVELWRTDGSAAETKMVYDLAPGQISSKPYGLVLSGGSLLIAADDGIHGHELFRVEVPAHAVAVGSGCAQRIMPRLTASPPQLNGTLTIDVADANQAPNSAGMLVIGWPPPRPQIFGGDCTLYVDFIQSFSPVPFQAKSGHWSMQTSVPGHAILHGIDLFAQVAVGPTGQQPFGLDLSNGLLLALRR